MAYTTIDNPELYFQTKLYTGTGSEQAITLDGSENMQPDWVWVKCRSHAENHVIHDSVRGATKVLHSDTTDAEYTVAQGLKSFDSDGFTLGTSNFMNQSSRTFASWNWKAGGSASSNSDGSTTSSVSANTTAGFSIVSWTGTGSATTVGHGLGAVPKWIIVKNRDTARNWNVYYGDETDYLQLNDDGATIDNDNKWNDTAPTSSVFTVNTSSDTNKSGDAMIAYCFANIKGYSKLGSYEGNGNADGTFVYLGFRPAWLMVKPIDASDNWVNFDNKRLGFNSSVSPYSLHANKNFAETTDTGQLDFLSNGFKIRNSGNTVNRTSTFIYMAFAESPLVNSNGIPNNAR